jgi:hypothetical protein
MTSETALFATRWGYCPRCGIPIEDIPPASSGAITMRCNVCDLTWKMSLAVGGVVVPQERIDGSAGINPAGVRMGQDCACHAHRELVPTERHHVWPLGMGGPDIEGNKITVCANAHYSIHAFLDLLVKGDGQVSVYEARRYGAKVRRYARSGYAQWKANQP